MDNGNLQKTTNGNALDREAQLWDSEDELRGRVDASEFKRA